MNIAEYRENIPLPLRQATLCFLTQGDEILLAMKKRGFGKDRWNGVGGKCNEDESICDTAIREAQEEIDVRLKNIELKGVLDFYFFNHPELSQRVIVYFSDSWEGTPMETEEMRPKWYKRDEIPFDSMWSDDKLWLPMVLFGSNIYGEVLFGDGDIVLDYNIKEVKSLETFEY